jgi:hypothetical protein
VLEALHQRAGQGAQPRPDLDHVVTRLHRQQLDNVGDDLPIDQEMLAKALARDVWPHALSSRGWRAPPSRSPARWPRTGCPDPPAGPREFQRRAMINRGANNRQAKRDVDAVTKTRILERGQALIVVHRKNTIATCQHRR